MLKRCRVCNGINPDLPVTIGYSVCDCATNPKYWRGVKISVQVPHDWLTADEDQSMDEGWKELENELAKSLTVHGLGKDIKVEFEEWDGEPEVQGRT